MRPLALRRQAGALALALAALSGAEAWAQGALPGLPIVPTPGGWARYRKDGQDGVVPVVMRVGPREKRNGREATWIGTEVEVPGAGRLLVEYLVAGKTLEPKNMLAVRASVPGQEKKEMPVPMTDDAEKLVKPTPLNKKLERISGKQIEVTTFSFGTGLTAEWSPSVPGFGFVRIAGKTAMVLEDFGVGGDPWRGAPVPAPPEVLPKAKPKDAPKPEPKADPAAPPPQAP